MIVETSNGSFAALIRMFSLVNRTFVGSSIYCEELEWTGDTRQHGHDCLLKLGRGPSLGAETIREDWQ